MTIDSWIPIMARCTEPYSKEKIQWCVEHQIRVKKGWEASMKTLLKNLEIFGVGHDQKY